MSCTIAQIGASAAAMANCQSSILSLIDAAYAQNLNYKALAIQEVIDRSNHIAIVLQDNSERWLNGLSEESKKDYRKEYVENTLAACKILYTCGDEIEAIFQTEPALASKAAIAWAYALKLHLALYKKSFDSYNSELMDKYARKIEQYDAAYAKKFFYERYDAEANHLSDQVNKLGNGYVFSMGLGLLMLFLCLLIIPQELESYRLFGEFDAPWLDLFVFGMGIPFTWAGYKSFRNVSDKKNELEEKINSLRNKQNAYR